MGPDREHLRALAQRMFAAAVAAADPAPALRRQLIAAPLAELDGGRYILIAVGKAAVTMMTEALRHLPTRAVYTALAVTNYENAVEIPGCTVIAAGHPVPDANGLRAGRAVIELLQGAGANDRVLALISGGGSALLPAPVEGIGLEDKAEVSRILLGAGFDITEMNLVRQQLSQMKGGGLSRLAAPAPVRAYILSDVIGDDLRVIASGPTATPIGSRSDALDLLRSRNVFNALPKKVKVILTQPEPPRAPHQMAENVLICSNRQSLESAVALDGGLPARIVNDRLTGDVAEAAAAVLAAARAVPEAQPMALVFGGETTVNLTGTGLGGRNQELALRVAFGAEGLAGAWVFLSGGTDGRDGPTDAAGGLVDAGTLARIAAKGLDATALLANNDSHAALSAADDLLRTGATGTNVADVQIFLRA